jgi:hypothetical protein
MQEALVGVEGRLAELSQKEMKVFEAIKAARAAAHDATAAHDQVRRWPLPVTQGTGGQGLR